MRLVGRDRRLIVETDGGAADGTRRARERDRVRDADLQLAGWIVIRVPYMRLLNAPDAVAAQVARRLTPAPATPAAPRPP
jgi:very-short-patch-repair endonuclease